MIRSSLVRVVALAALALTVAACGDNLKPDADAASIDGTTAVCGNALLEAGEGCDDGDLLADAVCGADCQLTCGNGIVDGSFGETCDPGIASGDGACPAACDDGMACTADVLAGTACQAACVTSPITAPASGDGCCPPGATMLTDSDCIGVCGNGVVEAGESCDTGIAVGAGACPIACNDGMNCTTDRVANPGTCAAVCSSVPITAMTPGDGCCLPGGTPLTDLDCVVGCGDGIVSLGETCDTAITSGPGRCPTACSDNLVCTRDTLTGGGSCTAACSFPPITVPANGDGCCPPNANANTDNDCTARCGNGVAEPGEQCDDGNLVNGDACSNACIANTVVPTMFRMNDLDLRDPHVFINLLGCRDVTDTPIAGFSVNGALQTNVQTDGSAPPDGLLDLSIAAVFRPLAQTAATSALEIQFPPCTSPLASTTCRRNPPTAPAITATATNLPAGQCLGLIAGTTHGYSPAVTTPSGPCFVSNPVTVTIDLAGIPVVLRDTRIAATYVGSPAANLVNGLLVGFISEADANTTMLPATLPLIGGQPLSQQLPGGDPPGANNTNCAAFSDVDINNGVRGWWFYLNFTAPRVTYVEN